MLDALKILATLWAAMIVTYGILAVVLVISRGAIAAIRRMVVRAKAK
jgi:hypothetical protein